MDRRVATVDCTDFNTELNMMNRKLKNIVFDFGGVIVDLDKRRVLDAFRELGVDAEDYVGRYAQAGPFERLELGVTDTKMFCGELREAATACSLGGSMSDALTDRNICRAWNRMLVRIPQRRIEALKRLRCRYRLFMLSNTNEIHWNHSVNSLFGQGEDSPAAIFEQIFLSYQMHMAKPSLQIFSEMLSRADINPDETLYIDDSDVNCEAARKAGMHTYVPEEADDWMPLFIS